MRALQMSMILKYRDSRVGYYPSMLEWGTSRFIRELRIDEMVEIFTVVMLEMYRITGGPSGDKVRQLNDKPNVTSTWKR